MHRSKLPGSSFDPLRHLGGQQSQVGRRERYCGHCTKRVEPLPRTRDVSFCCVSKWMSGHGIHHPRESRDMPKQPSQNAACLLETKSPTTRLVDPGKPRPPSRYRRLARPRLGFNSAVSSPHEPLPTHRRWWLGEGLVSLYLPDWVAICVRTGRHAVPFPSSSILSLQKGPRRGACPVFSTSTTIIKS